MARRNEGRETIVELKNWDRGQAASERLASKILGFDGFDNVDPSHPTGGPDGGKDMVCFFNGNKWIGAVYFPQSEKSFADIKAKFQHDLEGARKNDAVGMAFLTNQTISISNREILSNIASPLDVRIYHVEKIANILDDPRMYGVRLEFLDIEMTKEEQLSYFAAAEESRYNSLLSMMGEIKELVSLKSEDSLTEDWEFKTRTMEKVQEAENEFYEKIWLDRHFSLEYRVEELGEKIDPEIWRKARESAQKLIDKYGTDDIGPYSDFEWGMLNGKLSALRWILGCDWDMLDT